MVGTRSRHCLAEMYVERRRVARARERATPATARTPRRSRPQRAAQHPVGVAECPACSLRLVVFLGACTLSLWGVESQGRLSLKAGGSLPALTVRITYLPAAQ